MAGGNHEFELIERIRRQAATSAAVALGIGDDAALVTGTAGGGMLVALDVLMEGVHFDPSSASAAQIGRKALGVNLSDIAAMAGRPMAAFVGLVLPSDRGAAFADDLMAGLLSLAGEFDVALAGGDTNIWNGPGVISVTLLGEPTGGAAVPRCGAHAGDWLMVTGALGGSRAGRHLSFTPRVREAQALHAAVNLHAMIDLSDGLASDVGHLLRAGGVGAVLEADAIPVHDDVAAALPAADRLQHALSDGEDFELLFCVEPAQGQKLLANPPCQMSLTRIGMVTADEGCWLRTPEGSRRRLDPTGWEHRFPPS